MKSPARPDDKNDREQEPSGPNQNGPNLVVMYALIVLALVVAIGFAALIVWPFYQNRH